MLSMCKLHKSKRQLVPILERMAVHAQASYQMQLNLAVPSHPTFVPAR